MGGNAGGIYNVGVILSQVPVAQKDTVVAVMQNTLDDIARNGLATYMLSDALEQQAEVQQFGQEEVFVGFAYANDLLVCVGRQYVIDGLRADQAYFKSLAAEW